MATPITPGASNPVLAAAEAALRSNVAFTQGAQKQQAAISQQQQDITGVVTGAIESSSAASQVIATQQGIADLEAQNNVIESYEAAGGFELQKQLATLFAEKSKELNKATEAYTAAVNREPEGVLDYLFGKDAEINAAYRTAVTVENERDNMLESIQGITAAQESIARAATLTKKTVNTATIAAGNQQIADKATLEAAKAKLQGLALGAEGLARSVQLKGMEMEAQVKVYTLHNTEESAEARRLGHEHAVETRKFQQEQYKDSAAQRKIALEQSQLNLETARATNSSAIPRAIAENERAIADLARATEYEASFVANVQKGAAALGLPVEQSAAIISKGIHGRSQTEREIYNKLDIIGADATSAFGATLADSVVTLGVTGALNRTEPAKLALQVTRAWQESPAVQRDGMPKNADQAKADLNAYAKATATKWAKEIKPGDNTNPYTAPPMEALKAYKAITDSKLYKNAPAIQTMKEFDSVTLFNNAVVAINAGTVSMEEAALGLEAIYGSAVDYNNNTKMFARVGLPVQDSYKYKVIPDDDYGMLGATTGAAGALTGVGAATMSTGIGLVPGALLLGGGILTGAAIGEAAERKIPVPDLTKRLDIMYTLNLLRSSKRTTADGLASDPLRPPFYLNPEAKP